MQTTIINSQTNTVIPLPTLVSNGKEGVEVFKLLKEKRVKLGNSIFKILCSDDFNSSVTKNVTYYPVMTKAKNLKDNFFDHIYVDQAINCVQKLGGTTPPLELSPLLAMNLSRDEYKKLGVFVLIPLSGWVTGWCQGYNPQIFALGPPGKVKVTAQLDSNFADHFSKWGPDVGFVYLVSKEQYDNLV